MTRRRGAERGSCLCLIHMAKVTDTRSKGQRAMRSEDGEAGGPRDEIWKEEAGVGRQVGPGLSYGRKKQGLGGRWALG